MGGYGVSIFFLLSGFLIAYSNEKDWKRFAVKRIARIVPLYYILTVLTYLLVTVKPDWFNTTVSKPMNLLYSLFFIPYINPNGLVRPILDVSWALLPEVWLYVIYMIGLVIKEDRALHITVACFGMLLLLSYVCPNPILDTYRVSFACIPLGIIFSELYRKNSIKKKVGCDTLARILMAILFFIGSYLYNYMALNGLWYISIMISSCVFSFFVYMKNTKESKVLAFIAQISYSMYLTHEFIVKGINRLIIPLESVSVVNILLSFLCLLIAIIVGSIVYKTMEKPMQIFVLKILKRK